MNLSGNTILITGGTSGIGLALGKYFLAKNNKVILLGRNQSKLGQLQKEGFEALRCDLSNQKDIEETIKMVEQQFDHLNVLINNAGIQYNYLFPEIAIPFKSIEEEIEINVTGQMVFTQLLIPILAAKPKAFIINTTSALGAFPKKDALVYSASKAAFRNFTQGLRITLKNTSIKIMEFIPPVTETNMTEGRLGKKISPEELISKIIPQMKNEKELLTTIPVRAFLWIAFLFPGIAEKILSK
ncbi:SDR family oxidoreductase [Flexithrix dorotheae]|uniref:SDR family oxidoreductase n=1 Tax=Flexithrix dorotheae TaxID=70993 RepID=UPI00035EA4DD|nr:SDR family NAD(P)-dependent oxidoreductase [Flexithrix dorotheae]